jgi:hypothetical protein
VDEDHDRGTKAFRQAAQDPGDRIQTAGRRDQGNDALIAFDSRRRGASVHVANVPPARVSSRSRSGPRRRARQPIGSYRAAVTAKTGSAAGSEHQDPDGPLAAPRLVRQG